MRLNIKIDLGRHHNKNKNPVSDNACKEFHKEVLRLKPDGSALTDIERAIITSNLNQRIRKSGFSSKEICFKRDVVSNEDKVVDDEAIAEETIKSRQDKHNKVASNDVLFNVGDNVYLKDDKSKWRARHLYRVIEVYVKDGENWATIQKHETQFRVKKYQVKFAEIILVPGQPQQAEQSSRPRRKAADKARELFTKICQVKSPPPPMHGCDYETFLKLAEEDDVVYYCQVPVQNVAAAVEDEDNINEDDDHETESDSPTQENDEEDEFQDANDSNQGSHSNSSKASSIEEIVEENRLFLQVHPTPRCKDVPPPARQGPTVSRMLRPDTVNDVQLDQVQRLDHLLTSNRMFLANHPRPVMSYQEADNRRAARRSNRETRAPSRYGFD